MKVNNKFVTLSIISIMMWILMSQMALTSSYNISQTEFSTNSTITTSTKVLNVTSSTVLKDSKQQMENDIATGFIIVIICVVFLCCGGGIYKCVTYIKGDDIDECRDAVNAFGRYLAPLTFITADLIDDVEDDKLLITVRKVLTGFILCLSIVSAFFLSDFSGYTNELNGSIVIFCSIISYCLSCCRVKIHERIVYIETNRKWQDTHDRKDIPDRSDESEKSKEKIFSTINKGHENQNAVGLALMMGSLSDALFDIIQGLALSFDQKYENSALGFLITATFVGASSEVVDLLIDIGCEALACLEDCSRLFVPFLTIATAIEIGVAFYLATFYATVWETIVIVILCIFTVIAGYIYYQADLWMRGEYQD